MLPIMSSRMVVSLLALTLPSLAHLLTHPSPTHPTHPTPHLPTCQGTYTLTPTLAMQANGADAAV